MHHAHRHFASIESTHTYVATHAAQLEDGTIVTADEQTAGVGRAGRAWISGRGDSLLLTMLLKRAMEPADAQLITPLLALAVRRLLAGLSVAAAIKWPNDVTVGGKKIAGMLSAAAYVRDAMSFVVASVGLNVRQGEEALAAIDIPATSIFAETGIHVDPASLCEPLVDRFDELYARFARDGFSAIVGEWRGAQTLAGRAIRLNVGAASVEGVVTAFGDDGGIELALISGEKKTYYSGEVVSVR